MSRSFNFKHVDFEIYTISEITRKNKKVFSFTVIKHNIFNARK